MNNKLTLSDNEISSILEREVSMNGHFPQFALQVSKYIAERMIESRIYISRDGQPVRIHIVVDWPADLLGSVWSEE